MFEKVNPTHPDKLADRIAGAIVDFAYVMQKDPKIAVEVMLGHGSCFIIAETSVHILMPYVKEPVEISCAIGDETVDGKPYSEIVETAREFIERSGGFEKFAEWGLVR